MRVGGANTIWQIILLLIVLATGSGARASAVFARFKVVEPAVGEVQLKVGGFIHKEPWYLPTSTIDAQARQWSDWLDVSHWPLHDRLDRSGGIAEWPAMRVAVAIKGERETLRGCRVSVELADAPSEKAVIHSFSESSESDTIAFLL